ncbi:hypothetical protein EXIGLDRAFT_834476 [Exidia glandulosa HHB12029]|uniref:Uncharacterized protein n=1 Tax=Exidia glandulosa HHB12029 TaxID=1314781 RepID=A0A165JR83_EXIGL|nr:hypothetical protein EXIGLDRAFT_834476 [Exidia glandulosa HHB12029]
MASFFNASLEGAALIQQFVKLADWCKKKYDTWPSATDTSISIDEELAELNSFLLDQKFKKFIGRDSWGGYVTRLASIDAQYKAAIQSKHDPQTVSKVTSMFTKAGSGEVEKHKRLKEVMRRLTELVDDIHDEISVANSDGRQEERERALEE